MPVFENDKRKNGCNASCTDCSFSADSFFPVVLLVRVFLQVLAQVLLPVLVVMLLLDVLHVLVLIRFRLFCKEIGDEAHGDKSEGHPFGVIDVNAV